MDDESLAAARVVAATVLVNLGLAATVGAWASALWLRRASSAWAFASRHRSWAVLKGGAAFAALADGLLFWLQAADMGQVPVLDAVTMLPSILWQTHLGHAWAVGALGLLVVVVAALRPGGAGLVAGALGIGLFAGSRAAVSHAAGAGLASLPWLIECAHLAAISVWVGAVGIAGFSVLTGSVATPPIERADAARWVESLSATASGALGVIVGTGLFNAWRGLGSMGDLVGTVYGTTLLVKVGLVAVAIALGGFNRFRGMPPVLAAMRAPMGTPDRSLRGFVRVLRIEAVVLLAALIAAAILSASPSPMAT